MSLDSSSLGFQGHHAVPVDARTGWIRADFKTTWETAMTTAIANPAAPQTAIAQANQISAAIIEKVVIEGDLSVLDPQQRVNYYRSVCESIGLNPLTKPFEYLKLNGKLQLYARKECAEQLRSNRRVSLEIVNATVTSGVYVVTAKATLPDGRTDSSTGAVLVDGLRGEALANAMMKAETKAKRRVTLSICGLGFLDESEIGSIPGAQVVSEDELAQQPSRQVQQPQGNQQLCDQHAARMRSCKTLDELKAAVAKANADKDRMTKQQTDHLVKVKEECKAKFEQPNPAEPSQPFDAEYEDPADIGNDR